MAVNTKPAPGTARRERADAKRSAALTSFLAASGITVLKLITGLLTGSLGMLSEAAHSGIDLDRFASHLRLRAALRPPRRR